MPKRLFFISSHKTSTCFAAVCITASLILILLSRYAEGFAQWYAVHVYPVFPNTFGRASSLWKHSFFEAVILVFALTACILLATGAWMLLRRKPAGKISSSLCARLLICTLAGLMLVYTMTCAINYQRDSIGTILNLPADAPTKEKLKQLSMFLVDDLTRLTSSPEWDYSALHAEGTAYIENEAVNAMKLLGESVPSLAGYYPKPKPVFFSKKLSGIGIEGIFSPITMEANYNCDITPFLIPYAICHELAHVKGYMKEDDAGFISYLACRNSPSKVFQYSGIFRALIFSLNALKSEVMPEEYNEIYQQLPEPVKIQLIYVAEHYQERASSLKPVAKSVNDLYLKANAQTGIKSYGRIVDLLIADYADRINEENLL